MMEFNKFKVALCQLSVITNKKTNIDNARRSIQLASKRGSSLVILPEMWNCPYSTDYFDQFAETFDGQDGVQDIAAPSYTMLSQVASREGVTVVGGSIPERSGGRLYNTCCVFGTKGELLAKHRKLHMFDIDIPGDILFKESDTFSAGGEPTIVDTDVGRIGIGICHDIRFPELAMLYRARGAHLICYPGAFNISTGEAVWDLSQRARAVDNQVYIATCSPSRESAGSYAIWGHSSVINPWGEVIATCGHGETMVISEVDYSAVEIARERLPIAKQRRQDLYQMLDSDKVKVDC